MFIKNNEGKDKVSLFASEDGGFVGIRGIANKEVVIIGTDEDGDGRIETRKGEWRTH